MVSLSKYVKSYFAETSLHGLKYITEEDRHPVERILWIILFALGVALEISFMVPGELISSGDVCCNTNLAGIEKYINQPTSTSLETRDFPVWNIDFPGVTICPTSKVTQLYAGYRVRCSKGSLICSDNEK